MSRMNHENLLDVIRHENPPVFCVGRTQGSSRDDTGEFVSDTGEFQGEFLLMGGFPGGNRVCFCT